MSELTPEQSDRLIESLKQQLANVSAELQVMTRWHRYVRAKLDEVAPGATKTIPNYQPNE